MKQDPAVLAAQFEMLMLLCLLSIVPQLQKFCAIETDLIDEAGQPLIYFFFTALSRVGDIS